MAPSVAGQRRQLRGQAHHVSPVIDNREELARSTRHEHALGAVADGVAAAHPARVVERAVSIDGDALQIGNETYALAAVEDLIVLGGGNAAGHVAAALEAELGDAIDGGLVVTDDPVETARIEVQEGTHPLPSAANVAGTSQLLDRAAATGPDDLVLVVVTGGGSALLCAPAVGVALEEYEQLTDGLLRSGATIDEINAVRKHVSQIKGGQLARALAPSRAASLVISDVVGNRLDTVASGPTVPDSSTYADAAAVCDRYDFALPESVERVLRRGRAGDRPETPGDPEAFDHVSTHVLAESRTALDAAAATLGDAGYDARILSSRIEGEAREVGTVHVGIAAECLASGTPFEPPVALLSGGETTVTVQGEGHGGPNQEFALSGALALDSADLVVAAVDTDGIDGNTDAAGAIVDADAVPDGRHSDARRALENNDAYGYLDGVDRLLRTGATGTNVNDLRVVLVGGP